MCYFVQIAKFIIWPMAQNESVQRNNEIKKNLRYVTFSHAHIRRSFDDRVNMRNQPEKRREKKRYLMRGKCAENERKMKTNIFHVGDIELEFVRFDWIVFDETMNRALNTFRGKSATKKEQENENQIIILSSFVAFCFALVLLLPLVLQLCVYIFSERSELPKRKCEAQKWESHWFPDDRVYLFLACVHERCMEIYYKINR